jgi:hypothetical protein
MNNTDDLLRNRFSLKSIENKHLLTISATVLVNSENSFITRQSHKLETLFKELAARYLRNLEPKKREIEITISITDIIREGD